MARNVPAPTPAQQEDAARLAALTIGTPEAVRAWAETYNIPLLPADDDALLVSIHEARANETALPPALQAESRRWLRKHKALLDKRTDE